jgi:GTP-binding protein HflX
MENAFLVAVVPKDNRMKQEYEDSIEELGSLAKTADARVVGKLIQPLRTPSRTTYIGKGKLEELKELNSQNGYDLVIFEDELSPIQQRNLEKELNIKIIDRAALILDIFARHARTSEGKLQVELAQHQYLLPRLAGQWSHLERLGGGIGTRGPGESQLETDRRLINKKIHHLKKKLEEVRRHRSLHRQKRRRSGVYTASLVGYTNSGKSSVLNALCGQSMVLVQDKLFATLDPTTRHIQLSNGKPLLISDTVGFIRKLPPTIIDAFRATLEELAESDLLIHIVDITADSAVEQCHTVEEILKKLKVDKKPRITALNKIDLILDDKKDWTEQEALDCITEWSGLRLADTIFISAEKKWGLKSLSDAIATTLDSEPLR